MVRIALAAFDGLQHLADDHNGRVTHIVLYILQPHVDGILFWSFRNYDPVTVPAQHMGDEFEMDRSHLGHQNGVGLLAIMGKVWPFRCDDRLVAGHVPPAEPRQ